jgi:hypothetical protein
VGFLPTISGKLIYDLGEQASIDGDLVGYVTVYL